jgi:hypothetical protein
MAKSYDTFDEAVYSIADEMAKLVISKQKDYGQGNILAFGEYGIMVRMSDKFERLKNLMGTGKQPSNESMDDTLSDIMGYASLWKMLRQDTFTLPLKED